MNSSQAIKEKEFHVHLLVESVSILFKINFTIVLKPQACS